MNAHNITHVCLAKAGGRHISDAANEPRRSGYVPELLQDDSRALSRWFASQPGARLHAKEAAEAIRTFAQIDAECNAAARSIVRGVTPERLRQFEDARELMGNAE